jgi:hypothetical protein
MRTVSGFTILILNSSRFVSDVFPALHIAANIPNATSNTATEIVGLLHFLFACCIPEQDRERCLNYIPAQRTDIDKKISAPGFRASFAH